MIKIKMKSAIPVYLIGVVWIIYGLIFPLYRLSDLIIAAALSAIAYIVSDRLIKPKEIEIKSGVPEIDEMIEKGKDYLKRLRELNMAIEDREISARIAGIENISAEIFDYVAHNPDKLRRIKSFTDYYIPTTLKLLETYDAFSRSSAVGEDVTASKESIRKTIEQVESAFKKQAEALHEDSVLNISVEISVLKQMMSQDGLIDLNKSE